MAVYLDNNATTALDEKVLQAMLPFMGQVTGNPSSVHRFGRLQKDAIEQAREQVAALAGARTEQVIFTSGGTESNNLLLRGFSKRIEKNTQAHIVISAIEHMSLLEPAQDLSMKVDFVPVDEAGGVSLQAVEQTVTDETSLMSVMSANNETGVIQNLKPLIAFARERDCFFHTDASQTAGKLPLHFTESGLHAMTLSAHKMYGPVGAGALVVDKRLPLSKIQFGGWQENNLRAGTENVPAIVGFGKAAELALSGLEENSMHTRMLRDTLEKGLKKIESVTIFAEKAERLPNTVQFGVDGFAGETLLMYLDKKIIAVSSGSACASGKAEASHVLRAMNVPVQLANSAIRVSIGKNNTMSDIDALLVALSDIVELNRHSKVTVAANV